jgi:hypothetical protein
MGDDPAQIILAGDPSSGAFAIASFVASNVLQGVIGQTMGVLVFNGTAEALITPTGDYALAVPTPDWANAPAPINLELDATSGATITAITGLAGLTGDGTGFYVEQIVPEPSSFMLVGIGLFAAIGIIRRRRS